MQFSWCFAVLGLLSILVGEAGAQPLLKKRRALDRVNSGMHGTMVDYTKNHGADRRIWSPALQQWRDLYVYVPPGYDPQHQYPVLVYMHGFTQDEYYVLQNQIALFDKAIVCGQLPPVIIVIPDGSILGRASFLNSASFFCNSRAGNFEDFLIQDVWNFVNRHYSIRPEPEAHALVGASMGGSSAFQLAIKYRSCFKIAIGFFPALNLRWVDCHDRYMRNFDPHCWGWRSKLRPNEVIGRFYGVVTIRYKRLSDPLFGRTPETLDEISRINPIEALDIYDLRPGELSMFVAYGGRDEFNIDAQVESFLHRARERCLEVSVAYDPDGRHDLQTGVRLFPAGIRWLAPLLAPYSPTAQFIVSDLP